MSEEPAIAVNAAAIMPPVQDSAVASRSPAAWQASSTATAFVSSSVSDKTDPHQQQQRQPGIHRGKDVVEHDAEAAVDRPVGEADRPRLDDVGDAEEHEAGGIGQEMRRRDREDEELRRDLVDDDG